MSIEPILARPSQGFAVEAESFLQALDTTSSNTLSACVGWTAHEVVAHLVAASVEVALNLEAYGSRRLVPPTRGFQEREAPYRAMDDVKLRSEFSRSIERMAIALDEVLGAEPDAVVPWTGRQMVVASFVTHLRSEFAIHRFDLVGDDETGTTLLAQPELTDHAVEVLARALVARGAASAPVGFSAVIAAHGARDVVLVVDGNGPRLTRSDTSSEPAVVGDPAARLLFLWGRRPGDPRRISAPQGAEVLAQVEAMLVGY
ncbi:MAG: maleylpyruvate isomerase family mycothiol-dependent enzyme [Ferrimicrobium sp.]